MNNFTKMMDAALKQGLIKWIERTGTEVWYLPTQESMSLIAWGTNDTFMLTYTDIENQGHRWAMRDDFIPLISIEQLMGMAEKTDPFAHNAPCMNFYREFYPRAKTWRELWLQIVMQELHNKKWNGAKWE